MHIAFGRVRHKTSPTRGGENVCLFFWFTIVLRNYRISRISCDPVRLGMPVTFVRARRKTAPTGSGLL